MTVIRQADFIQSIADALQYVSYYHPADYLRALGEAYAREQSSAARDAIAQILTNSRMCADGHRPICQDTGIVVVFLEIGMDVHWDATQDVEQMVNEGVRSAYTNSDNPLRASMVSDPAGARTNTGDNTPAVVHMKVVRGNTVEVRLAAKGGGGENKAKFTVLMPSDSIADWVLQVVPTMGAGWCPPGVLGIGVGGGNVEKAMLLAKEALLEPIDIHEVVARGPTNAIEALRIELYEKINALGIGAQGLGGLTTVLDVKILDYPAHASANPVAVIPNCAATRVTRFTLDGSGPAKLRVPRLEDWPDVTWTARPQARRVDLGRVTRDEIASWQPGETLLLRGKLLTGRDAAHKRIVDLLARREPLPPGVDFTDRFIYFVGPVAPVRGEAVGPAGPTTATRMDKFAHTMLERTGLLGMIGKAERGPRAIEAIKQFGAVYLVAVGGAAYLVSKAIRHARVVAFADLGMEAIFEFDVHDMPVTVAVDTRGNSIHATGPAQWRGHSSEIRFRP
jgi:fumarate hydratase, class I